jgi:hypothetical protein
MAKKLTGVRKMRTVKMKPEKIDIDIRVDMGLSDGDLDVIFIETSIGRFHLAGVTKTFTNELLAIDEVQFYGLDGIKACSLGLELLYAIAQAAMEVLDVDKITLDGWRSTGARPGRPCRTITFRRRARQPVPAPKR